MSPVFICPHCHIPVDPSLMERAFSANAEYRICPECDEPVVVADKATRVAPGGAFPVLPDLALSPGRMAESRVP